MTELIYFSMAQPLDRSLLEEFLRRHWPAGAFHWVEDIYAYAMDNELDPGKTYISLEVTKAAFCHHYSVYAGDEPTLPLRRRIELLGELARSAGLEILSTDDEASPWSRVLIGRDGQASTVQTAMGDEPVVEGFYNFPFGDFRTKRLLEPEQLAALKGLLEPVFRDVEIDYSTDGPVINGAFNKVKEGFPLLRGFDHHYEVRPLGKTRWLDREQKSERFIGVMRQFQKLEGLALCIFPRNFSVLENIEGGSDTEEHCIVLGENGELQKIVYKPRRRSWPD